MTRTYRPRQRYEYRVRYRRAWSQEQVRTFGRLPAARRYVEKVKGHESPDPMFPAERLLYVVIDRRPVGSWELDWPDPRR